MLSLFPQRAAIGRATLPDGSVIDVFMTPEYSRALGDVLEHMGGDNGMGNEELATLAMSNPQSDALVVAMYGVIRNLTDQLNTTRSENARLAQIERKIEDIYKLASLADLGTSGSTDWTRPGKIGSLSPNTGRFTTLSAVTYNGVTITAPAGGATFTLVTGKTFKVNNTVTLIGTDGTVMTLPDTSATLARTDMAQTFSGAQTFSAGENIFGGGTNTSQIHINGGNGVAEGPRIRFERAGVNKGSIGTDSSVIGTTSDDITIYSPGSNINFWAAGLPCAKVTSSGVSVKGGTQLLATFNGLNSFDAAAAATMTNAPVAGNPTKWVAINDNGTTRYLPLW